MNVISAEDVLELMKSDSLLTRFIDISVPIPNNFRGSGEIKLILIGQDPTVKIAESRKNINTVLNLDKNGSIKKYVVRICDAIGIKLEENVFATNFAKNFFVSPPASMKEIDVLKESKKYWLPLLQSEIKEFPKAKIISLGEPILNVLVKDNFNKYVRFYWNYTKDWEARNDFSFGRIEEYQNEIDRVIYPLPHRPALRIRFYKEKLEDYLKFVAEN
ncbi:hypothetical protein ASZ90_005314 [hydrocarbon metagenome]|uniref:Uracil-DNA glycosylase-like domain-containing protein n=1 Tax=hydrocarbon metagenome TaxID=938273 RepID=A0A0W8FVY0_9ZZZZ